MAPHHAKITALLLLAAATPWAAAQTLPARPAPATATKPAATKPGTTTAPAAFGAYLHAQLLAALNTLAEDGDLAAARAKVAAVFEIAISRAPDKQLDLLRDPDYLYRLLNQLESVPATDRIELLQYLRAHDEAARALVFSINPGDPIAEIYALFDRLRKARPNKIDSYANLVAAICIVHATPLVRNINEVNVRAADPLLLFDYYVTNENAMAFGVKNVPPELLKYVVDTTCSIDEMQWALAHYAHDPAVGQHFFDIKYDDAYFASGAPKKLGQVPYNLPNILQVGGVCADQAYFAVSIGKAIGVPTAYTIGSSAETGHAWVGFLQAQGNRGAWNFNVGRYEEFRGVRGLVLDPQSRHWFPDAFVSFSAEMINVKPADRQTALAISDAADYLVNLRANAPFAAASLPADLHAPAPVRTADITTELDLLKRSLITNPGNTSAWLSIADLAEVGKLTYEQKTQWSDELLKQCGTRYPDFAVAVVIPMIATVEDPAKQNTLWNAAFNRFSSRFDLAATIRMQQAALWEKQKEFDKAGQCYYDVITRYANAGPFVLAALAGAEKSLRDAGRTDKIVPLYEDTWTRCQMPADMAGEFARESNWYRVGTLLAKKLSDANQPQQAQTVQRLIASKLAAPAAGH